MKLQFDVNQEYQKKAVKAGVDIFKGQANNSGDFRFEINEAGGGYLYNSAVILGSLGLTFSGWLLHRRKTLK